MIELEKEGTLFQELCMMKKGILNLQYIVGKNSPDRYSIYGKGSDGTWLLCQHTQVMFPGAVSYVTDESHSSL